MGEAMRLIDGRGAAQAESLRGGKAWTRFGLKVDEVDHAGLTVKRLFTATDRYVIYAAEDGRDGVSTCGLHFEPDPDEAQARALRKKAAAVAGDIALITDALWACKGLRETRGFTMLRRRVFATLARALTLAFEDEPKAAQALLAPVRGLVEDRRDSRNRMRYVLAVTAAFALIGAGGLTARTLGWAPFGHGLLPEGVRLIDVLLLGATGAFFALAIDCGKVRVRHALSWAEMCYAGVVRVPVGVIAAAVAAMLALAGWLPGGGGTGPVELHLIGFLAGFSEMLAPNA